MHMYRYWGQSKYIVDGDTLDVHLDLGFRTYRKIRIRLEGIDTPEIYGVKKGSEEYERGMEAKEAVEQWVKENSNEDDFIVFDSREEDTGKYGRWIGDILNPSTEESLVEYLKEEGYDQSN